MIFSTDSQSEWVYATPMQEARKNSSVTALDGKIYVLGGESVNDKTIHNMNDIHVGRNVRSSGLVAKQHSSANDVSLKSFVAYDTEKKTWETLPDYPGTETGICKAAMFAYNNEITVVGGQTDTSATGKMLNAVYAFNTETKQWQKKADMAEGRTNLAAAVSRDQLYAWTKAGATDKAINRQICIC